MFVNFILNTCRLLWGDLIARARALVTSLNNFERARERNKEPTDRHDCRRWQLCNCPELPERSRQACFFTVHTLSQLALPIEQKHDVYYGCCRRCCRNAEWEESVALFLF